VFFRSGGLILQLLFHIKTFVHVFITSCKSTPYGFKQCAEVEQGPDFEQKQLDLFDILWDHAPVLNGIVQSLNINLDSALFCE